MRGLFAFTLILITCCTSCRKNNDDDDNAPAFKKVVILGNSILYSPANTALGWNGNWGMAASAASKDYVHLLTERFKSKDTSCEVNILNIAQFERGFDTYDLDANLKDLRNSKPDLLIIRIGENVAQDVDVAKFDARYTALINYFTSTLPNLKVLAAGSFWQARDRADQVMQKHSAFVALNPLGGDMSNYAWGLFSDQGVASHPNDKGMKAIVDAIWPAVEQLRHN